MNVYIASFYQVRNMPTSMLPVSTAVWDPKWFHDGKGNNHIFKDKRGVINGVRCLALAPTESHGVTSACSKTCPYKSLAPQGKCLFLKSYRAYLSTIDFERLMKALRASCEKTHTTDICLLVYEAPDNPCSERGALVDLFSKHNVSIKEFKG